MKDFHYWQFSGWGTLANIPSGKQLEMPDEEKKFNKLLNESMIWQESRKHSNQKSSEDWNSEKEA